MALNHERAKIIEASDVTKRYRGAEVLRSASLGISSEEFILIAGPSGSGKTTLLNMLSSTDKPDQGSIEVYGRDITQFNKREQAAFRAANGMIFQRSGLLSGMTARENILGVHELAGRRVDQDWLDHIVTELSISALMDQKVSRVSGGQAQRIGIARALAHQPRLVFADEPTAALDAKSTHDVHRVLRDVVDETGATVVMVSHDDVSKQYVDGTFEMNDGRLTSFNENIPTYYNGIEVQERAV